MMMGRPNTRHGRNRCTATPIMRDNDVLEGKSGSLPRPAGTFRDDGQVIARARYRRKEGHRHGSRLCPFGVTGTAEAQVELTGDRGEHQRPLHACELRHAWGLVLSASGLPEMMERDRAKWSTTCPGLTSPSTQHLRVAEKEPWLPPSADASWARRFASVSPRSRRPKPSESMFEATTAHPPQSQLRRGMARGRGSGGGRGGTRGGTSHAEIPSGRSCASHRPRLP